MLINQWIPYENYYYLIIFSFALLLCQEGSSSSCDGQNMDSIIAKDTLHTYLKSEDGFKYYYVAENKEATYKPAFGDMVDFTYSLSDIYGKEIYSKEDTKVITYYVDKQELFQGLRQAIKLLKENEEAVFFFPSEIAFGYHGDKEKIGVNKPIRAQVHILKITPAPPPPPSTSESVGLVKCDFE